MDFGWIMVDSCGLLARFVGTILDGIWMDFFQVAFGRDLMKS